MDVKLDGVVAAVTDFVTRTRGKPARPIQGATQLFAEGLLDSFAIVDLTIELEEKLGLRIPDGLLLPEDFETVQGLRDRLSTIA